MFTLSYINICLFQFLEAFFQLSLTGFRKQTEVNKKKLPTKDVLIKDLLSNIVQAVTQQKNQHLSIFNLSVAVTEEPPFIAWFCKAHKHSFLPS